MRIWRIPQQITELACHPSRSSIRYRRLRLKRDRFLRVRRLPDECRFGGAVDGADVPGDDAGDDECRRCGQQQWREVRTGRGEEGEGEQGDRAGGGEVSEGNAFEQEVPG